MNLRFLLLITCSTGAVACLHSHAQENPFAVSPEGLEYLAGQAIFEKVWVSAPASTAASDGLGPLYNARSCSQCHEQAGKGRVPQALTLRIDHETFGKQIQERAIAGVAAENRVEIRYSLRSESITDTENVAMHEPEYIFMQESIEQFSPRLAPSLAGVGLLEAIPWTEILEREDPEDSDGDGISGRAGTGRFGWKAEVADLAQQTAFALSLDMGISSALFPAPYGDCTVLQNQCLAQANGASGQDHGLEIDQAAFDTLLNFIRNIPAPAEQAIDTAGEDIFSGIGCIKCHQGDYMQGSLSPYSDMLLHDMGDALADNLDQENAREWRTPPLWGLSAYQQNTEQYYLHDGRARSLTEAILWHGGEAETAKQAFKALAPAERMDLINFLQSI